MNEVYGCKLGDFKNWTCYAGLSTDSWAAQVGSDGAWTGAVNYQGYPTFFKETVLHRISVSGAGAHRVTGHAVPRRAEGQLAKFVRGERGALLQGADGDLRL